MKYSIGEHTVETFKWETFTQMSTNLNRCDVGSVILNDNQCYEAEFYSVNLNFNYCLKNEKNLTELQNDDFGIGLCNEVLGITPNLLWVPPRQVVIGFGYNVVGFRIDEKIISFQIIFDTPFRSFCFLEAFNLLLVFNEIGVIALTQKGSEVWRYEKDILTRYTIDNELLIILFMDSPPIRINLLNGQIIEH